MWRLLLKNLFRNKRRTFLTASSVAVSLFLLSSLAIVYTALGMPYRGADTSPRMMVRRASGIIYMMPYSYDARIKAVPGVVAVTPMNFFGGHWKDPQNQFANFAIDPDSVFAVLDFAKISPEQLAAFKRDRTAAVAGQRLIDRFHWKIGDRITLLGSFYGVTPEVTLVGTFTGGTDDQFYFRYDYLNELMNRFNLVNLYWIRLERPELASQVSEAIDRMFRNTDTETKTESEGSFLLGFISMLGNVRGIILMVGSAVSFAILLVVANTMAMSIRERTQEAAVMRSLGFRPRQIVWLFMAESLALTVGAAVVGVGGAKVIYDALRLTQAGQFVFADMRMRPETLLFCTALSPLIALLAAGGPAYRASRTNIAEALRYTG